MPDMSTRRHPLRVAIQQPALPRYRAPLFRALAARDGYHVRVAYGDEDPALENVPPAGVAAELVPVRRLRVPLAGTLFWHAAQWRLADRRATDVLVLSANTRYLGLVPAMLRARLGGVPVALWGHGYSKSPSAWRDFLRTAVVRLADAVVLYDARTAAALAEAGLPRARLFVAANGLERAPIDAARAAWAADPGRLARFRAERGLGAGPVLLHVGRLHAANRLDLALGALAILRRSRPDARLAVVGAGAPERARLEARARELGVADALVWAGALYDEDDVAPWMLSADAFVYPANAGLSIIHAFNYGVPVVVAAPLEAHNPEIVAVADGVNAVVAPRPTPEDVARACALVLDDPARRARLSDAALATARDTFNTEAMAAGFVACIDALAPARLEPGPGASSPERPA